MTKAYAGVQALADASLELRAGEVHALVGENGAGKSTLIKILTGAVQPDSGEITLDGKPLGRLTPRHAKTLGIAAIYQQPALFGELTVAENIALGVEKVGRWGRVDWSERHRRAKELLDRVGARIDPETEAEILRLYRELPDLDQVLARPDSSVIPREPAILFALVGALVERCRQALTPLGNFVTYALRLPDEFAMLALRDALAVNPKMASLPTVQQWIARARQKGLFLAA